jgi:dTDP-4-amino-4,6-dideoxygalactose transaminase
MRARINGTLVGTLSDISVFSFNTNKIVHCGEGGCCLTRDADLAMRLRLIRNHGEAVVGAAGYENIVNMVGQNYRMTELHAAIALVQQKKLEPAVGRRRELAAHLATLLEGVRGIMPLQPACGCAPSWYVFPMRLIGSPASRRTFVKHVSASGVMLTEGYVEPLYLQPLYQRKLAFKHGYPWSAPENRGTSADYSKGVCPTAERLHGEEMVICRLVRAPHLRRDMNVIASAIKSAIDKMRPVAA